MSEKKKLVNKMCPRCNKEFICNEDAGCQCEQIFLTKDILASLRTKYVDCLCGECLRSFTHSEN